MGYVPSRHCESKVIFIPKAGKDDYSLPKSFRPISLTSCIFKVLERVILNELDLSTFTHNPLSRDQHAFRKGSSCETALSAMVDNLEKSVLRGEYAVGVFLDIAGAFDNLRLTTAKTAMEKRNLPPAIRSWYSDYLENRIAHIELRGEEVSAHLRRGTPQGGVLSPVLWNISFDDFLRLYEKGPVRATGYADDGALVVCGKDPKILTRLLQQAIKKALKWGEDNGLVFAPAKTVAVVFTHKHKGSTPFPKLRMGQVELPYADGVKYLGVFLDSKLTFKTHLTLQCKKATRLLMSARGIMSKLTGLSPKSTKWIYDAMVLPIVLYGALIWAHRVSRRFKPFIRLQRLAMMCMGAFSRSTPTFGLEITLDIPPLDIKAQQEAAKAAVRIRGRNRTLWDGIGAGSKRGHLLLARTETGETDLKPTSYHWDSRPVVDWESFKTGTPQDVEGITCYTDGSQMSLEEAKGEGLIPEGEQPSEDPTNNPFAPSRGGMGNVGFGFVISKPIGKTTQWGNLGEDATVFQGEVFAVHKASEWLRDDVETDPIHFFIDSQAAIRAIAAIECDSITVANCKDALKTLMRTRPVTLHWVRAHVGHKLNEEADRAAKFGTFSRWVYKVPISPCKIKQKLKQQFRDKWIRRWSAEKSCRQTRLFLPQPDPRLSKALITLPRKDLSMMVQFLTGHNHLNYHRNLMRKTADPKCRLCKEEPETSWHLITECPSLEGSRWYLFLPGQSMSLPDPEKLMTFVLGQISYLLEYPTEELTQWD